ncbi:MAG TPA: hypothetical protein DCX07_12180, partial [Phycisphaerales bacterium]|nr:hypothetical protein [Phycisphaerales bacterium]
MDYVCLFLTFLAGRGYTSYVMYNVHRFVDRGHERLLTPREPRQVLLVRGKGAQMAHRQSDRVAALAGSSDSKVRPAPAERRQAVPAFISVGA